MYQANGIDLPGSQYRELRDLVSLWSDEERKAFSERTLHPYDDKSLWNPNSIDCYKGLHRNGLIEGTPTMGGFLFYGVVTQAGIDFVNDIAELERRSGQESKSARRHDYLVQIVSAVISFVLGLIAEHFLGIVSMITGQ